MDQYTIYCTEEQTKKVLELGAPIMDYSMFLYDRDNEPKMIYKNEFGIDCFCHLPTAEQVINWLEGLDAIKGIVINLRTSKWYFAILTSKGIRGCEVFAYDSRKEATLAAIDAALEYLTNQKLK